MEKRPEWSELLREAARWMDPKRPEVFQVLPSLWENHRDTRCNNQAVAELAAAWSQDSESINRTILIIVIIFVSVVLTEKGAALGITKGCSSWMLCQRSLCCGINRIHAVGKGSTRLVFASIRDAHAPPTGSFTCLCHSGDCPKIFSSWKERKTLTNPQYHHSRCPSGLILYPGCLSHSQ